MRDEGRGGAGILIHSQPFIIISLECKNKIFILDTKFISVIFVVFLVGFLKIAE